MSGDFTVVDLSYPLTANLNTGKLAKNLEIIALSYNGYFFSSGIGFGYYDIAFSFFHPEHAESFKKYCERFGCWAIIATIS